MNLVTIPPYTVQNVILANQLADRITWGQKATGVEEAWKKTKGKAKDGRRVRIAVCDTGVDRTHLESGDLQNVVSKFDATGGNDPYDARHDGHGSMCLSIVGADADGNGVVGFCPDAELISVRCMKRGTGLSEWVAKAIDIARNEGANIISLSLGSPAPDSGIASAIERAVAAGIFVIAAAGNSGRPNDVNYPARWSGQFGEPNRDTIAVAATNEDGTLARYSSRGPEVDIAAPGTDVEGCYVNGSYARMSGTSFACPAIAGIVGLMLVRHWDLGDEAITPLTTMKELRDHLEEAAVDMDAPGRDPGSGWGLIKADKALAHVGEGIPDGPPPASPVLELGPLKVYLPARAGDILSIALEGNSNDHGGSDS